MLETIHMIMFCLSNATNSRTNTSPNLFKNDNLFHRDNPEGESGAEKYCQRKVSTTIIHH